MMNSKNEKETKGDVCDRCRRILLDLKRLTTEGILLCADCFFESQRRP